jgi:hypothetical protein
MTVHLSSPVFLVIASILLFGCAGSQKFVADPTVVAERKFEEICDHPTLDQPCKDSFQNYANKLADGARFVWNEANHAYVLMSKLEVEKYLEEKLNQIKEKLRNTLEQYHNWHLQDLADKDYSIK